MRRENIENAILTTFLDSNDLFDDMNKLYKLDPGIFTSPFRKRVAENINDVDDNNFGFLALEIEEKTIGTSFAVELINLTAQTSLGLGFSKKYHDKLVADDRVEGLL